MDKFDPTKFGAVEIPAGGTGTAATASFDPTQFGAVPTNLNSTLQDQYQPQSPVGKFVQGAIQAIANPFVRLVATTRQLGLRVDDLFGRNLTPEQRMEIATQEYDAGYFGKVKALQNPWDAMGVGAEIGSFAAPELKALKGSNWATNLLRASAPFAVLQTAGTTLQDIGEGKGVGQTTVDAAGTYIGSVAGFGLFKGFGSILKVIGTKALKAPLIEAANQKILAFLQKALSIDTRFTTEGAAMSAKQRDAQIKALEQSWKDVHKEGMDAYAETMQRPTNWDDIWRGIQDKATTFFDSMHKAKDAKYSNVFTPSYSPGVTAGQIPNPGYAAPVFEALGRAEKETGLSVIKDGHVSVEDFKASGMGEDTYPSLTSYINLIRSKLGTAENPKGLSMHDFDLLYTSAPPSSNPIERKYIEDLATSLYQGAKGELKKDGSDFSKIILQKWEEARTQWLEIKQVGDSKFLNGIKDHSEGKAMVEDMFKDKPTVYDKKIIDGMDAKTKQQYSDIIHNMALDLARSMNADYAKGGKALEEMLDRWVPTGIISPQDEVSLRAFSEGMQGTYDDAVKVLLGQTETSTKGAVKALDESAKAQARLEAAKILDTSLGKKPAFTINADGTYDFSNIRDAMGKLDESGEFGELIKHLKTSEGLNNVQGKKLEGTVKGIFGLAIFHQHPFIGLGLLETSFKRLFKKPAYTVTSDDVAKLTSDLIKEGRLDDKKFRKLWVGIINDDFKAVFNILSKAAGQTAAQKERDITE